MHRRELVWTSDPDRPSMSLMRIGLLVADWGIDEHLPTISTSAAISG